MYRFKGPLFIVLGVVIFGGAACQSTPPPTAKTSPAATAPSERPGVIPGGVLSNGGSYYVVYSVDPADVPLNELFDLRIRVFDGLERWRQLDDVHLTIDGRMPDHRHGMNREPRVERQADGSFLVTGMLFHMPGYWEFHFDVTRAGVTERAQDDVTLE